MRSSATGIILDLTTNGQANLAVTPSVNGPQTVRFGLGTPKFDARGNYPRAEGIVVRARCVVTNTGEAEDASTRILWEQLHQIITSFRTYSPLLGVIHDPTVFSGPVAKHVVEFLSLGGRYYGNFTQGVGGDDEAVSKTFDLYWFLPFTNELFFDPLGFCPWVGWLTQMELQITVAGRNVLAGISADALVTSVNLSAWVQTSPTKRLGLPAFSQWRQYTQPASGGSTQMLLQDVGQQAGLNAVKPGSRLASIIELCNPSADVGFDAAAQGGDYASFSCDQLSQPITSNVDAFVAEYRALMGVNKGPRSVASSVSAALPTHVNSGNPYTSDVGDGVDADETTLANGLMFLPWRVPGQLAEIGSQPKFQGNLTLFRSFSDAPSAGLFRVVTNEIRELNEGAVMAMLKTAGVSAAQATQMRRAYYDGEPDSRRSGFAIPMEIPNR